MVCLPCFYGRRCALVSGFATSYLPPTIFRESSIDFPFASFYLTFHGVSLVAVRVNNYERPVVFDSILTQPHPEF